MAAPSFFGSALALLVSSALLLAPNVAAQVTTDCNPTNTTNCPADPAFGMSYGFQFNTTPTTGTWDPLVGGTTYSADKGATFTIKQHGDSPTLRSAFYIFFGRIEISMKPALGTGIISSVMLLSDDLDEIDWEFKGGNTTHVFTNYFGKGNKNSNGNGVDVAVPGGVQQNLNLTILWTSNSLDFYVNTRKVRTLLPKDANNTLNYPQTPVRINIGNWAAGDPTEPIGVRQWAGGDTDFTQGPFNMFVSSVAVTDFGGGGSAAAPGSAKQYTYSDRSGSWQSIKATAGNSSAHDAILAPPAPPTMSFADRWNALSPTAKLAIYASAGGVGAALLLFALYNCIRQRRRGAREAKLADQRLARERLEMEQFRKAGIDPDSFVVENSEYDAKEMKKDGMTTANSYSVPSTPVDEKAQWETAALGGAAAAGGMRSPAAGPGVPLLRDGAQTPRMASPAQQLPAPYRDAAPPRYGGPTLNTQLDSNRMRSPAPMVSPMRTPSPGMPPSYPLPASPANRSQSSPNAQMRAGPRIGGYSDTYRTQSPGPMAGAPAPQRSQTAGGGNGAGGYRAAGGDAGSYRGARGDGGGYRAAGGNAPAAGFRPNAGYYSGRQGGGGGGGYGGNNGGGGDPGYW